MKEKITKTQLFLYFSYWPFHEKFSGDLVFNALKSLVQNHSWFIYVFHHSLGIHGVGFA